MCVCVCVCMCVYIYIHIRKYIYISASPCNTFVSTMGGELIFYMHYIL